MTYAIAFYSKGVRDGQQATGSERSPISIPYLAFRDGSPSWTSTSAAEEKKIFYLKRKKYFFFYISNPRFEQRRKKKYHS
jgi:hypothetical protein